LRRKTLILGALAISLFAAAGVRGQFYEPTRETDVYLESGGQVKRTPPPLRLVFELDEEIPLPGPLLDEGPRLLGDDRIEIPVADGTIHAGWPPDGTPRLLPEAPIAATDGDDPAWSVGPDEKFRFRALPEGRIVAEKRCRHCRRGWRRIWKLRVAGPTPAPPLVTERRVFFGALDNRVYSVRKRNGHRMWASDVGGRVPGRLALWKAQSPVAGRPPPAAILVVPGRGQRIVALDPRSGTELGRFELAKPESKWVGAPIAAPDGRIVAAAQNYAPTDAVLVVLRLRPIVPSPDAEGPVLYNDPSASGPAPAR